MIYFACRRYIIKSSGTSEALCCADALSSSSENRLISGMHYTPDISDYILLIALQNLHLNMYSSQDLRNILAGINV